MNLLVVYLSGVYSSLLIGLHRHNGSTIPGLLFVTAIFVVTLSHFLVGTTARHATVAFMVENTTNCIQF